MSGYSIVEGQKASRRRAIEEILFDYDLLKIKPGRETNLTAVKT
jgi:hypothetical protein